MTSALWRGSWATRARIASGLILYAYVLFHFLNIGLGLVGPAAADAFQDARQVITRSLLGSTLLYGALAVHAALALAKLTQLGHRRLRPVDLVQIGLGLTIPLFLAAHITFTRAAHELFATNDTLSYLAGLIWDTRSGWEQAGLVLVVWVHGSIGLHMWLRLWRGWARYVPVFIGASVAVPLFALAGFVTEGRRAKAVLREGSADTAAFMAEVNWPDSAAFASLLRISEIAWWIAVGLLGAAGAALVLRRIGRPRRASLKITYEDGHTINAAPGPTLLDMSRGARVPHMSVCGGRGRCTTCRVVITEGAENLPPPSPAEAQALTAVSAPEGTRLACQIRPAAPLTVHRVFLPEGRRRRAPATQGEEAQIAILFLDMRGFTARTTGQLPYDVVFLLNRFFDAIVPAIRQSGGTVDKYLGDGLLALFETGSPDSSSRAGLAAARAIGEALRQFNAQLEAEGAEPVRIGLSLHLGTVVLGEIGAAGTAPRTLIGDAVNTASRLEGQTKTLGVEGLISAPVLEAAGLDMDGLALTALSLRGVAEPLPAWPVADLTKVPRAERGVQT